MVVKNVKKSCNISVILSFPFPHITFASQKNFITMKIPGLSFSWKRALGVTQAKQEFARKTGIPTTKAGLERKIGKAVVKAIFGK